MRNIAIYPQQVLLILIGIACALPLLAADEPFGTGTGFVVSPDGYLLTCAHVVKDAAKLKVTLGAKTWDAAVLRVDDLHDLALLQISAKGLIALPLANSNAVEVGQEARAFGYPLARLLGEDMKVTRGTVAGISMREAQKVIQIDAAVNSGNSGGPLVNEKGEVLGVVNAKLVAVDVTNIGFAVPINYAKPLLQEEGVAFVAESAVEKMDGPALVKRVAPSVALITAWKKTPPFRMNPKDGAEMVLIPAGEFLMGTSEEELAAWLKAHPGDQREFFTAELPQRKVELDAFYMYKTEVTVAQYRTFCRATQRAMPPEPSWKWQDTHPIVNVTWEDAKAYADWAGATLPTEAQWEKAACGDDGRTYPWGNDWDGEKCSNSNVNNNPWKPSPVGSFPAGASPYGVMDMAGNVWEWCADWYGADYYTTAPAKNPTGPTTGTTRVLRGGSWYYGHYDDYARGAYRGSGYPGYWYDRGGFRCVLSSP